LLTWQNGKKGMNKAVVQEKKGKGEKRGKGYSMHPNLRKGGREKRSFLSSRKNTGRRETKRKLPKCGKT